MVKRTGLHRLAGSAAALVGAFLILGAFGHFNAVLPLINEGSNDVNGFALLSPGVILAAAGVLSVSLCKSLWDGRQWAIDAALASNAVALAYLLYLLWKGVPGHPVAMFTGIVACNLVLLAVIRAGLVWAVDAPMGPNRKQPHNHR